VLTTFDLDEYVFEALRAGVSGCLPKGVTAGQLIEAVPGARRLATRCSHPTSRGAQSASVRSVRPSSATDDRARQTQHARETADSETLAFVPPTVAGQTLA
jgi:DNA-binding NarL/FixJ family response regulator